MKLTIPDWFVQYAYGMHLIIIPKMHEMEVMPRQSKRVSTKVDLTAMVDLGFLLITFFMLASTLAKPTTMQILKPDETLSLIHISEPTRPY